MGTVTCCKRPNEVIEDKDLLKKATIKRDIRLKKDISKFSGQESPFVTLNEKDNHNIEINSNMNNSTNNILSSNAEDENKLIDLEKENLEHEPTIGPSDNLRKRKLKNIKNQNQSPKDAINYTYNSNNKTKNEYEQTQSATNTTKEKNKIENTRRENQQKPNENIKREEIINTNINKNLYNTQYSNNNQQQINDNSEKTPMDRVKRRNDKIINSVSDDNNKEPINNNSKNIKIKPEIQNINIREQNIILQNKLVEGNNKYFIPPTNRSIDFINNKYDSNSSPSNSPSDKYSNQDKNQHIEQTLKIKK